ncbi:MAG: site-specific integrase [Bacteriovorax sp.]|nr:site-specific integrase [Bacteriovorax sp.]
MGIKFNEKKNYWIVSYSKRHPLTRKPLSIIRKGIKSKAEALRVEKQLVLEMDLKLKRVIVPTWNDLVKDYIADLSQRDVSRKTVDSYRLCLEAHTLKLWGDKLIDEITSFNIRELIQKHVAHRSVSHQKNILKYVRGAFTYAVEKALIPNNPTPLMKFKIGDKIKKVLTQEQIKVLLTQAKIMDCEWYEIWATALYTGMRNGELYALTWDKVNLEQRRILVDSSWNSKDGFKDTKSGDDRLAEIAPELLFILKELKLKNHDSNFVLPRIDKWDKSEQARELRMFLMGLGLPVIRFHDLRASWATLMLSKGIPPIKVMSMAGWKDLKTMQYYIRKAGVDISGISDNLSLHNPNSEAKILSFV